MFALKRTSLGSVLDCEAPCLEESLLSLEKLRLEEVWKSFTEHTKRVDVWLKNESEKGPQFSYVVSRHTMGESFRRPRISLASWWST